MTRESKKRTMAEVGIDEAQRQEHNETAYNSRRYKGDDYIFANDRTRKISEGAKTRAKNTDALLGVIGLVVAVIAIALFMGSY